MPQMAPLLWLNLFIMFSITFIIFLTLNYFIKVPNKTKDLLPTPPKQEMSWKW
uniref:ATP synthase complex subunit 8 n=1 Tax=Parapenaeopsis hungerfordi TaxID=290889 RepID=A0A343XYK5_9EUCA|nr:ATP synthase F0 subunit 8 [Parapenaeopsis hungerfordi]AWK60867.1 ATP synthase F0 subunit 8 [Parapenaeopsis hungerfordi]